MAGSLGYTEVSHRLPRIQLNYLAHLYFSQPTVESRVGNLLGDFARGLITETQPTAVLNGLKNHRAIDGYTDHHPQVRHLKTLFSPQRRRFSGIILDVLFDHFLIHHWERYSQQSFDAFLENAYNDLNAGYPLMPEHMQKVIHRMIQHDWIRSYTDLQHVGFALDRIASRIRFDNNFTNAHEEIEPLYELLDQGFATFFPDLIQFVASQSFEK